MTIQLACDLIGRLACPTLDDHLGVKLPIGGCMMAAGQFAHLTFFLLILRHSGFHVNANRPLGKYAIPTTLKIEAPKGVTIGPISFPRAIVRKLKATNNESLAVYSCISASV